MKAFCQMLSVAVFAMVAVPALSQQATVDKERPINSPLLKAVGELDLTAEQKVKIQSVGKEFAETMQTLRKQGLTPALSKQRTDAVKEAREAGKKGTNLAVDVLATMKITDDQKAVLKRATEAQLKLQQGVAKVLTDEQLASLPQPMKGTLTRAANQAKKAN